MGKQKEIDSAKKEMVPVEKNNVNMVPVESSAGILDVFGPEDVETFGQKLKVASEKAKKIRRYAISMTNENDWVDQGGTPYMCSSGGESIRRTFGIDIVIDKIDRQDFKEEKYYIYAVYGRACKGQVCQSDIGTRSSRDKFFASFPVWENGKKTTKLKEMTEVDVTDVMKAAVTNFEIRAISKFCGLRNVTWDELKEAGLNLDRIPRIEYKGKKKDSGESTRPSKEKSKDDIIKERLEKLSIPEKEKKGLIASLSALTDEVKSTISWQLSILEKLNKKVVEELYTITKADRGDLLTNKIFQKAKTEEQLQMIQVIKKKSQGKKKEEKESDSNDENEKDEDLPFDENGNPIEERENENR